MRAPRSIRLVPAVVLAVIAACSSDYFSSPSPSGPRATVILATGSIADSVDRFRALLGEPSNGGTAGEQATGRREISWDGAGANPFNNKNDFPASFFNTNVKSGAVFTTPGTGFRNDSLRFSEMNGTYADQFAAFSPTKVFAPVGSNIMDVHFQVAGQPTPALVTGFGAVFSDVDVAAGSSLEFFAADGQSLGLYYAPQRSDASGLSFVGAKFDTALVAIVRIKLGTGSLGPTANDVSAGGSVDLVVVDNFIYGEPKRDTNATFALQYTGTGARTGTTAPPLTFTLLKHRHVLSEIQMTRTTFMGSLLTLTILAACGDRTDTTTYVTSPAAAASASASPNELQNFALNGIASGFPVGRVLLTGGGVFDAATASNTPDAETRVVATGGFRCIDGVEQGPLAHCATGEGVRWDTAQLLASTNFRCRATDVAKPIATGAGIAVLLADFYRAGDGIDESFSAQMIVADHDLVPELEGEQNLWIQGVGCANAVVQFNR